MRVITKNWKLAVVVFLLLILAGISYVIYSERPTPYMTVAFLNVGQGDAIYIESPDHHRIMVDGGPPHAILNELSKVMPLYERHFDTFIVTNPDTDHYAGFIDMLQTYSVSRVIEPGTKTDTATYKEFKKILKEKNIETIIAKRGLTLHLGQETSGL